MIGYVLSLTLLLIVAHLPIDRSILGSSTLNAYMAPPATMNESLPFVTEHEAASESSLQRSDPLVDPSPFPSDGDADETIDAERPPRPSVQSRLPSRRPEALASSTNLVSLSSTTRYMHTAISAPTVEDAPKLRIGTMLIDYPLSALKKAIQGLVIVRFVVETDGRAYGIDVVRGLEPACDAAVVSALREARFVPGRNAGRRVPAYSQIAVHFKIIDDKPWP